MDLISVGAAIERSGVPRRTLWRWLDDGTLTRHRDGSRTRVDLDELLRVLAARQPSRARPSVGESNRARSLDAIT